MSADLRARIADEVHVARPIHTGCSGCTRIADAVLDNVVQPELDAKDAEVARLTAEFEDAESELGQLEDAPFEAEQLAAERDQLRAAVERVRALVASGPSRKVAGHRYVRADLIDAALDQAPAAERDGGGR